MSGGASLTQHTVTSAGRWDEVALRWLLDERLNACRRGLLGREPYAVQTMLYFKPPGARSQALHQDHFYNPCD